MRKEAALIKPHMTRHDHDFDELWLAFEEQSQMVLILGAVAFVKVVGGSCRL